MVHIPDALRFTQEAPLCHHSPRLSSHFPAPAYLLIEEHLHARGPGRSQQIQDLRQCASGNMQFSPAPEKCSRIPQKAVVAKVNRIACQQAVRCDDGVVSVHKHNPVTQILPLDAFGHSGKRPVSRNYGSLQNKSFLLRQTTVVRDEADRRFAGIAAVHQVPDIPGGLPEG